MKFIVIGLIVLTSFILYNRYFPVFYTHRGDWKESSFKTIDVRDYHESYKKPTPGSINIPIAYLNRYYNEIPCNKIYVVAANRLEKNMGIRILRQKGFQVVGYTIIDDQIKDHKYQINMT